MKRTKRKIKIEEAELIFYKKEENIQSIIQRGTFIPRNLMGVLRWMVQIGDSRGPI